MHYPDVNTTNVNTNKKVTNKRDSHAKKGEKKPITDSKMCCKIHPVLTNYHPHAIYDSLNLCSNYFTVLKYINTLKF